MKIVLIGDSIRAGYDKYVKMAFDGVAEVYYPQVNCRFTSHILRHITDWKEKMNCGDDVDLVHWNAGVWDNLILLDNRNHTEIEVYRENVDRICQFIKMLFPKAKMIFATSTPVDEERFMMSRPKLFAAGVVCCGGGMYWNAARLKEIPLWFFHGAQDKVVYPEESLHLCAKICAAGGNAKVTIYPNNDHNCWDDTYSNEAVYEWLFSYKKEG